MVIIREIGLLKSYKAPGLDELLPPFFRDGGGVLISDLTKLGSIWTREEILRN